MELIRLEDVAAVVLPVRHWGVCVCRPNFARALADAIRPLRMNARDPLGSPAVPPPPAASTSLCIIESGHQCLVARGIPRKVEMIAYLDARRGFAPTIKVTLYTDDSRTHPIWFVFDDEATRASAMRALVDEGHLQRFVGEAGLYRRLVVRGGHEVEVVTDVG